MSIDLPGYFILRRVNKKDTNTMMIKITWNSRLNTTDSHSEDRCCRNEKTKLLGCLDEVNYLLLEHFMAG
jgi:hypothetical protein